MWLGRDVREVANWPAWLVDLYREFFEREPHPTERLERLVAQLRANYATVHKGKGASDVSLADVRPHLRAWDEPEPDAPAEQNAPQNLSIFNR